MLFNSIEFLLFFPLVTLLFFVLPHKTRWFLLLAASCYFYMFFVPVYILILAGTIVIDYFAGIWIENAPEKNKRLILSLSIIVNVGVLAFFKYYNFLNQNLTHALGLIHRPNPIPYLEILLPIGLSFHTFQAMSYTIEVYRENQKAERHFGIYALYVMFYPQLVAGPIERPQNVLHQFHEKKYFNYDLAVSGFKLMAWGMFKKVVIADRLSLFVSQIFSNVHGYPALTLLMGCVFFAFQLYADFSGYSDIAIGSARVMGFNLMLNFKQPFLATSISDFWRRWHISLSTWFADYFFNPLSFTWRSLGKWGAAYATLITFLVIGLWHGANWTFVVYGAIHGLIVSIELLSQKSRQKLSKNISNKFLTLFGRLYVLLFFSLSVIFFRAHSIADGYYILKTIFSDLFSSTLGMLQNGSYYRYKNLFLGFLDSELVYAIIGILILFWYDYLDESKSVWDRISTQKKYLKWLFYFFILYSILLYGVFEKAQFIYFQF